MYFILCVPTVILASGLVQFGLCQAQGSTFRGEKPSVELTIKRIDPNYAVYDYKDNPYVNSKGENVPSQEIRLWETSKDIFQRDQYIFWKATEKSQPNTQPVQIKLELNCEAPYFTKWKFNSNYRTATEKEFYYMDFNIQLMSRARESPFSTHQTKGYIKAATLTINSFDLQFKSVSIDCVKYDDDSIWTRLYIFQRSNDLGFKDARYNGDSWLPLSQNTIPCLVHDPHSRPTLYRYRNDLVPPDWKEAKDFDYKWKSGFTQNSLSSYVANDAFYCQLSATIVYYRFSQIYMNLSPETTKTAIQMTSTDQPGEFAFKCKLTGPQLQENLIGGNSRFKLAFMRVETCLSPDYCDFNRKIETNRQFKDCPIEYSECEIAKPIFNAGDKDLLQFEGKVACFVNIDNNIYSSHDYYFQGISTKYYLLSQAFPSNLNEILDFVYVRSSIDSTVTLLTCTALRFLTSTPMKLAITYVNNTKQILENLNGEILDGRLHGYSNAQVKLTQEMRSIECYVLWYNLPQWLTLSYKLTAFDIPLTTATTTTTTTTTAAPQMTETAKTKTNTASLPRTVPTPTPATQLITPTTEYEKGSSANVSTLATTEKTQINQRDVPVPIDPINIKLVITASCTLVGLLILMCLIACCIRQCCIIEFLCCPRGSKSPRDDYELKVKVKTANPSETNIPPKYSISLKNISVDYTKIVSQGQFSTVYQGCLKMDGKHSAVVKVNKTTGESGEISSLLNDVKMRILAGDTHANISSILGAYFDRSAGKVYIVMKSNTTRNMREFLTNKNMPIGQLKMLNMPPHEMIQTFHVWLQGVSKGLEFLHSKNIVHGNIAAENILVCFQNTELVSITGFSHSQQLPENATYFVKSRSWTCDWETSGWRWMPMESLRYMEFSTESDVWSFGVLMWEIFSLGAIPYSKLGYLKLSMEFIQKIEFGVRLGQPQLASKEIYRKMEACWSRYGKDRPKPKELSRYFNEDPSNCINYINLAHQK